MGTLSVSIQIFDKGFHRFKFNLKSGYHHIEIFPAHRKFLSFAWDFGTGSLRHFQFCVLLFGLSSSPFIFTKKEKSLRSVSLLENSFFRRPFSRSSSCLQHVMEQSQSNSMIDSAFCAIKWAHDMAGVPSPTDNPAVEVVRLASMRIPGTATVVRTTVRNLFLGT